MTTITEIRTVYLHLSQYSEGYDYYMCDMSEFGNVLVASKEIEVSFDIPDDFNPTTAKIDLLKAEKQRIQAEAHLRAENIEEQIQSLLCIEDQSEG